MRDLGRFVVDVTEANVIEMMDVMGDTNPVHSDLALVEELGLRGLVNQGPSNLAYALNVLIAWAGVPGAIRSFDVDFHAITCPGDRVVATGEVTSLGLPGELSTCAFRVVREVGSEQELVLSGVAEVITPEDEDARR